MTETRMTRKELWDAVVQLWETIASEQIDELSPEVLDTCRKVHRELWHDSWRELSPPIPPTER